MLCLLQPGTWAKFLPEEHGDGVQPEARALVRNAVERVAPSAWIPTHLCNRDDHTVHVGAHRGFLLHWLAAGRAGCWEAPGQPQLQPLPLRHISLHLPSLTSSCFPTAVTQAVNWAGSGARSRQLGGPTSYPETHWPFLHSSGGGPRAVECPACRYCQWMAAWEGQGIQGPGSSAQLV